VSPPAISRQLKVLERAGLIVRSREWMQSRKRTWEARMNRLEAHLRRKGEQDE
jgi:DNA-binding transcriptional ArsR family regulator